MRHDPKLIEEALAPLGGLPLWSAGRAADLEWFQGADLVLLGPTAR